MAAYVAVISPSRQSLSLSAPLSEEEGVGAVPTAVALQGEGGDGHLEHGAAMSPLASKSPPAEGGKYQSAGAEFFFF